MAGELSSLCAACCALSSFILFIMIVISFSSLDYNDYGLDYSAITKTISPKVHTSGIYFLGVGHSFIVFPKTVQTIEFSSDKKAADRGMIHSRTSDGLEVILEISFQYTYNKTQLFQLYATFREEHREILVNMAFDTLSDVSTKFSAYDFFNDRQIIGARMQSELDELLQKYLYSKCEFFQLRSVDMPKEFEDAIKGSEVKKQEIIQAEAQKNKTIIELETLKLSAEYNRSVTLNVAYGQGNATVANGIAKSQAFINVQEASLVALTALKANLKLDNKALIEYLKTKAIRDYEVEDHIIKRFDIQEYKGKGAYGIVWKAYDKKTKQTVALKKIFDAFQNSTDAQRTYREVVFLKQLSQHENVVKLISVIKADNNKDLYMVFEYMDSDLHKVIRADLLNQMHVQYIMYQLMKCLKYLHSGQLVHRDLKPANLLIRSDCKLKVADFGLARCVASSENNDEQPIMTEYVATRWYRAPEILYGSHDYTTAVDIWSAGCILGEMLLGKAIFAGTSTIDQIEKIAHLLGRPNDRDLEGINAPLAPQILDQINSNKKYSFAQFFSKANELQLDFLRKMLTYDPNKRISAEQALDHPYLKDYKGSESEIELLEAITIPLNDNKKLKLHDYRDALYSGLIMKKKKKQIEQKENKLRMNTDTEDQLLQPAFQRCRSRIDKRSESVNKKFSSGPYMNKQDLLKFHKTQDKSKSFHLDSEEVIPTVHKSTLIKQIDTQIPTTSHQKQNSNNNASFYKKGLIKQDSVSRDNSRAASAEGTITQQLIAHAQQQYNKKIKQKKEDVFRSQVFQKIVDNKRESKYSIKKSKTPELINYNMKHSRSFQQNNKNQSVSRSSSKPKTRGSPFHSEAKVMISQPDVNTSFSKSFYTNHLQGQLYQKILSKQAGVLKYPKFNYDSLKK